jgi:hypothetical protein
MNDNQKQVGKAIKNDRQLNSRSAACLRLNIKKKKVICLRVLSNQ